jgi:phage tail sheath protein FI
LPVIGDVAGLMAETDYNYDPWWATAGLKRGVMRNVIKLAFNPNKANKDMLYFNSINPIVTVPGEGAGIILGQKTSTNISSAMDRLNVRRLLITVEKATATALRNFLFEFNDEATRSNILGMLNPYYEQVKSRRGVYDYLIVCSENNNTTEIIDQNALVVDIYLKPTKVAEFIRVNVIVTRTGANFSEVVA